MSHQAFTVQHLNGIATVDPVEFTPQGKRSSLGFHLLLKNTDAADTLELSFDGKTFFPLAPGDPPFSEDLIFIKFYLRRLAAAAAGSLTFGNTTILDTETFILEDGVNPAVTFEFDDNGSVVESNVLRQIDISAVATVDDLKNLVLAAVAGAPVLDITAADGGAGIVSLENLPQNGAAGNIAIIETVADAGFVFTGMVGGVGGTDGVPFAAILSEG